MKVTHKLGKVSPMSKVNGFYPAWILSSKENNNDPVKKIRFYLEGDLKK